MTRHPNTARIRELNDGLRTRHQGGTVLVSSGIDALGPEVVTSILNEVAAFDAFTKDNDPYGEHDCATLILGDNSILWKIDYYDNDQRYHSPNPSDPSVTSRVMTVMLSEEY